MSDCQGKIICCQLLLKAQLMRCRKYRDFLYDDPLVESFLIPMA